MSSRLLVLLCITLLAPGAASAEVYKFEDKAGQIHYVDELKKVPEEYREQVDGAAELPRITRAEVTVPGMASRGGNGILSSIGTGISNSVKSQVGNFNLKKVEVLMTDWCPVCKDLEKFLKKNKINFSQMNIEKSARAAKLYEKLGGGGVPIVKIGESVIKGFDPTAILTALKR